MRYYGEARPETRARQAGFWGINLTLLEVKPGTGVGLERGFDLCSVFMGIKITLPTNPMTGLLFLILFITW